MVPRKRIFRPGETTPESGQYKVVKPNGEETGLEITGIKGKTLPPTALPGQGYVLIDKTKHAEDKK